MQLLSNVVKEHKQKGQGMEDGENEAVLKFQGGSLVF